jgi:hypothetical protein
MDITKITRRLTTHCSLFTAHCSLLTAHGPNVGAPSGWLDSSDPENPRCYFRICGGAAWPHKGRPGFVVLVGEQERNLRSCGPPVFYGLAESEQRTSDDMLSKCVELAAIVDTWYSNIIAEAHRVALHQFNLRQEQKHLAGIQLINAPMLSEAGDASQLFSYADAEIDQRTSEGRKTVFLGGCTRVKAALQRVPEEWDSAEDILKQPEVTALYYVLGAMFRFPYTIPSREPAFAKTEYDIFNPPWEKNTED